MYFLILRPQQKKVKDHAELVKNIRRGDTVVTTGGLVGKVTKVVDDDQIEFEISDGVRVRQMRQMISGVRAKGEPAKEEAPPRTRRRRAEPFRAPHSRDLTGQLDVVFHAVEGAGDHPDGAGGVPLRRPEFLLRSQGKDLAGLGAAASGARPRPAGRLLPSARGRFQLRQEGEARPGPRRRAPRAARGQDRLYRPCLASRRRRGARQGHRSADRADQTARAVAAARRVARLQRPAQPRGHRCRRRADPADGAAGRDHRAHPPDHRAIDPDRRDAASTSSAPSSR